MSVSRVIGILLGCLVSSAGVGAGFVINVGDSPGEGFNDPTPRTSDIDGQPTTLGQDRLDCVAAAAQAWADFLDTSITIELNAQFNPLPFNQSSAVLGGATPNDFARNFAGAPLMDTWFVIGQANQLSGSDLNTGVEIIALFNSSVDGPALGSVTWYYGIDGNPPPNTIDLFSTALHELGHGLGFTTPMNLSTGNYVGTPPSPDMYVRQLRRTGAVNLDYTAMTAGQRAAANISGQVVWKGANVVAAQGGFQPMFAPNPLQDGSSIAHWDSSAPVNLLMEPSDQFPFIALTLEVEAFMDLQWPLAADPLDPNNVFVDFEFAGFESGGPGNPFNSLAEAIAAANPGATINIAAGAHSPETFTGAGAISKQITLVKNGAGSNPTVGNSSARTILAPPSTGRSVTGFVVRDDL